LTNDLKIIENNRDALLLAQAGALLHNLGKVTSQFYQSQIDKNSRFANYFKYQHILHLIEKDWTSIKIITPKLHAALGEPENLNVLDNKTFDSLTRIFKLSFPFDDRDYRPGDMIEYLGQGELDEDKNIKKKLYAVPPEKQWIIEIFKNGSCLTHLMNRCHRGASGGEKQDIWAKGQDNTNKIFISTPFGWESQVFNLTDVDTNKLNIEKLIKTYLGTEIADLNINNFADELNPIFEAVIADTQRPLNDVTVWDIGHSSMAFLLAQAIGMMAVRRAIGHDELSKIKHNNTLFWRVLGIRMDGIGYLEDALSLADLKIRSKLLDEAFRHVLNTLEGLPVAIEIYRDENGSFYIFPDLEETDELVKAVMDKLKLQLPVDGVALKYSLSGKFINHPQDLDTGAYIGDYISQKIKEEKPILHTLKDYTIPWANTEGSEVCVACGVRPQGYGAEQIQDYNKKPDFYTKKAKNRDLCCICMNRRRGVAENWATDGLDSNTIWIDEVADKNGRVALVVGQFDLEKWSMWYPKANEKSSENLQPIKRYLQVTNFGNSLKNGDIVSIKKHDFIWDEKTQLFIRNIDSIDPVPPNFVQEIQIQPIGKIEVDNIQREGDGYRLKLKHPHGLKDIGKQHSVMGTQFIAADELTLITVDDASKKNVDRFFLYDNRLIIKDCIDVHAMTASQSFARLRRIWETTKHFWEKAGDFSRLRINEQRLQITGKLNPKAQDENPGHYHVYQLLLNNTKLSAVWDKKNNRFITASNLEHISQSQRLGKPVLEWLSQPAKQEIKIEEPTGYGSKNKEWGTITIKKVEPIPYSEYIPAIPILAEPRTFMALVPADKALEIVNDIKNKYEVEMGKVRNRLPLHLGIVFADYKTPLRVILDAGRRMLKQESCRADGWHVINKEGRSPDQSLLPDHLKNNKHFAEFVRLELKRDDRRAVWHVPLKMGDGNTPDEWYPYVFVQYDKDGETPSGRKRMFEAPCPWNKDLQGKSQPAWLVHASDIHEGDVIYFTPSTLDFQWLDTGGRRFEIAYDNNGCRLEMQRRPYMLEELEIFKKIWETLKIHLTSSQIHALNELIETKRNDWKNSSETSGVFTQFCQDTIANIEWMKKKMEDKRVYPWGTDKKLPEKAWLDEWTGYAVRGLLTDVIELNMKILKKKPECEEKS